MSIYKIRSIGAWVTGGFFFLLGITGISPDGYLGGFLLLVSAFLTIPTSFHLINDKFKGRLTLPIRILIIFLTFISGMIVSPSPDKVENIPSAEEQNTSSASSQMSDPAQNQINQLVDESPVQEKGVVESVTDGDTIRVTLNGESKAIRLIGIDAPELNPVSDPTHCYSQESKEALEDLILNKEVVLEKDVSSVDKYDRELRYIWLGELLLNEYLTHQGYVFEMAYPPDTKYQNRIKEGAEFAKTNAIGLWADNTCKGNVYTGTYKDPNNVSPTPTTTPLPTPTPTPRALVMPVAPSTQAKPSSAYTCNCKKTCAQMSSCEEAQYQLKVCGCGARDNDKDGIACDSDCQ